MGINGTSKLEGANGYCKVIQPGSEAARNLMRIAMLGSISHSKLSEHLGSYTTTPSGDAVKPVYNDLWAEDAQRKPKEPRSTLEMAMDSI